jgi:hypothetical protein
METLSHNLPNSVRTVNDVRSACRFQLFPRPETPAYSQRIAARSARCFHIGFGITGKNSVSGNAVNVN